jgi:hypothetical protein
MTRIIRVVTCDRCPHAYGSRGCTHPDALVEVAGVLTIRMSSNYFVIPDWCTLEQAAPDWRPPATIDLNGPPSYSRGHDHRWENLAEELTEAPDAAC